MSPAARPRRALTRTAALLVVATLAACSGGDARTPRAASSGDTAVSAGAGEGTVSMPAATMGGTTPAPRVSAPPGRAAASPTGPVIREPGSAPEPLAPLDRRVTADVLVSSDRPLTPATLKKARELGKGGALVVRLGKVRLGPGQVMAAAVDADRFRAWTPKGTAEATAVWDSVVRGEVVVKHSISQQLKLKLGHVITVAPGTGGDVRPLRLGALATTGIPGAELVVDDEVGGELGLAPATGVLLSAGGGDVSALADRARRLVGDDARVDLLTAPAANPVAFLTGSRAAKAFGAFSYRYFSDGTIQPDDEWVRRNIKTKTIPIMGRVTCHRLMLPQLEGALAQVAREGLGDKLKTFDGCYVPRFIERNPERPISLHTWGIAIDMDAATNYRGIRGTMDIRVVNIFKAWGFRWGGDWNYTDSMHFELGALLKG